MGNMYIICENNRRSIFTHFLSIIAIIFKSTIININSDIGRYSKKHLYKGVQSDELF